MLRRKRIVLYPRERPRTKSVNINIQYFGSCLGLFGLRDKDSSCFRIFIELVKSAKNHESRSSQTLAYKLGLTRGTVVHHLNKLMDAGIVKSAQNRYFLKENSLEKIVDSINKDISELMISLRDVATELDKQLSLDRD